MADKVIVKELVTVLGFKASRTGLDQADNMLDKFQKKASRGLMGIVNIGAKAVIGVGAFFAAITGGSIYAAASLESITAQFEVMLGSAEKANKLVVDLQQMGAKTPFKTKDLAKGAQTLLAFGLAAEEILPTLRNLGDIAGNDNNRLKQLTLAFAQMQSAGRLMGQDLLQMVNAGFNPLQTIAKKTGKSMLQLKKDMEAGAISADMVKAAFRDATSEGGRFYQNMLKQSKTFKGVLSTLVDNVSLVGQVWGKTFLGSIKTVASALITLFQGPVMAGVTMLSEKLLPDMESFGDTVAESISKAGPLIEWFFQKVADGIDWFKEVKRATTAYLTEIQPLLKVVGIGLGVLLKIFNHFAGKYIDFMVLMSTLSLKFYLTLSWLIKTIEVLYTSFKKFFSDLGAWFTAGAALISNIFSGMLAHIKSMFKATFKFIGMLVGWVGLQIKDILSPVLSWIEERFNIVKAVVLEWVDIVLTKFNVFKEAILAIFTTITDFITGWASKIADTISLYFGIARDGVVSFGDYIKSIIVESFDFVLGYLIDWANIIGDILMVPINKLLEGFAFLKEGVKWAMDGVADLMNTEVIKELFKPFRKAFEFIMDKIRSLVTWMSMIPGLDIKLPDFPDLDAILNKPKDDLAKTVEKNAKIQNNKINQIFNTKVNGAGMDGAGLAGALGDKVGGMMKAAFSVQLQDVIQVSRGV